MNFMWACPYLSGSPLTFFFNQCFIWKWRWIHLRQWDMNFFHSLHLVFQGLTIFPHTNMFSFQHKLKSFCRTTISAAEKKGTKINHQVQQIADLNSNAHEGGNHGNCIKQLTEPRTINQALQLSWFITGLNVTVPQWQHRLLHHKLF